MESQTTSSRCIVVGFDDSDNSEAALHWVMVNTYRPGDIIHILHIIPRHQISFGTHPPDAIPRNDEDYEALIKQSQDFILKRAVDKPFMKGVNPLVHIIKYQDDADSIGRVICEKSKELDASLIIVARHSKSKLQQIWLGSTSTYVCKHSTTTPVLLFPVSF